MRQIIGSQELFNEHLLCPGRFHTVSLLLYSKLCYWLLMQLKGLRKTIHMNSFVLRRLVIRNNKTHL